MVNHNACGSVTSELITVFSLPLITNSDGHVIIHVHTNDATLLDSRVLVLSSLCVCCPQLSLRYRAEDGHLRLFLHEVKHKKKKGVKSSSQGRSYFVNTYLLPDEE